MQWTSNLIGLLFGLAGILVIWVRFTHVGRVCSGDFLADLEKENDVVRTFYDIDLGLFLFIIAIINIVTLSFTCLAWICCCGFFCCVACGFATYQSRTPGGENFTPDMTADQMN